MPQDASNDKKSMNDLAEQLFERIKRHRLVRAFCNSTMPRWLILLSDVAVVLACTLVISLLSIYSGSGVPPARMVLANLGLVGAVFVCVSYYFKSYACIIRLSVVEDLYRVLMVELVSTVAVLLVDWAVAAHTGVKLMPYRSVAFIGATSFTALMIVRLLIKHFYAQITQRGVSRRRVLVLGTSLDSIILANALKNEINGKYDPVGLIATGPAGKSHSAINGFAVYDYSPDTLANVFVEHAVYALVFDSSLNDWVSRDGVADYLLQHHIAMLAVNRVEEIDTNDQGADTGISNRIKPIQIEDLLGRKPIVLNSTLVRESINGECVMVSGSCGSIGSEIVRQLSAYKAKRIVLVDQAETPMHDIALELREKFPEADVVLYMGDVTNRDRMERAFKAYRPKYVFHAAAYKHVPMMELNPTEAVLVNVMGTRNMADLALKYGVCKFVMVSTDKAVNPSNVMGCTKRLAEIYVQSLCTATLGRGHSTQFITTRFGNVLGSNGSVIPLFRRQIEAGGPITVTHRDIIRYFMTIPEACSLVLEAGCMGHGGEIYIFDMGQPVRIYDLAKRMISLAGLRPGIDIQIKEVGLRPGEKLYEELLNDKEKTQATRNNKIMIAQVRTYDNFDAVCRSIDGIIRYAEQGRVHDMVHAMKEFVPEYKSLNSEFEKIDTEIATEEQISASKQAV